MLHRVSKVDLLVYLALRVVGICQLQHLLVVVCGSP